MRPRIHALRTCYVPPIYERFTLFSPCPLIYPFLSIRFSPLVFRNKGGRGCAGQVRADFSNQKMLKTTPRLHSCEKMGINGIWKRQNVRIIVYKPNKNRQAAASSHFSRPATALPPCRRLSAPDRPCAHGGRPLLRRWRAEQAEAMKRAILNYILLILYFTINTLQNKYI